jgi:hypothetical protein
LAVGVHRDDVGAARLVEPGGESRRLPKVAAEADDAQVRFVRLQAAQHLDAIIRAAIIHRDNLIAVIHRLEGGGEFGDEGFQVPRFVVDGQDDG